MMMKKMKLLLPRFPAHGGLWIRAVFICWDSWCIAKIDIGQGYTGPKTGDQGQGIDPGTLENIMLHGQGFEPWTHKNQSCARPGV